VKNDAESGGAGHEFEAGREVQALLGELSNFRGVEVGADVFLGNVQNLSLIVELDKYDLERASPEAVVLKHKHGGGIEVNFGIDFGASRAKG